MMRLFSLRSLGEIGDSDRREYSGLIGEDLASVCCRCGSGLGVLEACKYLYQADAEAL